MWAEYFSLFAFLFLIYSGIRMCYYWERRGADALDRLSPPSNATGRVIDASVLADRVQHVREDYQAEMIARPTSFKRALLVESRRAELSQLPFFHRPVPPETPKADHGVLPLLLA
jgi:hypothetical protein